MSSLAYTNHSYSNVCDNSTVQCSKLKFFRSHLLVTSLICKMVTIRKIVVAKSKAFLKQETLCHFT